MHAQLAKTCSSDTNIWVIVTCKLSFVASEHRAIHPYIVQQEGDLSFERGETVIVFEMLANGWWRGCSNGQEGWFPATYVEVFSFHKNLVNRMFYQFYITHFGALYGIHFATCIVGCGSNT